MKKAGKRRFRRGGRQGAGATMFTLLVAGGSLSVAACAGNAGNEDGVREDSLPLEGAATPGAGGPELIIVQDAGLDGPESALHDPVSDVYLVSNFAGDPTVEAGNGFISRISPQGEVLDLRWIDGHSAGVTLHAPRGMALRADTLYVADIGCVRRFLRENGTPLPDLCLPGSGFLNGVSSSPDGWLFVSDSGTDTQGDTVQALHAIAPDGDGFETVARGSGLGRPNGVLAAARGVVTAVSFAEGRVYRHEYRDGRWTGPFELWTTPTALLDGIIRLDDGSLLVSSLENGALYRLGMDGSVRVALTGFDTPADIGIDRTRGRVLIPELQADRFVIRSLPPG